VSWLKFAGNGKLIQAGNGCKNLTNNCSGMLERHAQVPSLRSASAEFGVMSNQHK